jgi:hypothetical protein
MGDNDLFPYRGNLNSRAFLAYRTCGAASAQLAARCRSTWFEHVDAKRVYEPLSDKYGADKPEPLMRTRQNDAH